MDNREAILKAREKKTVIPAYNIPYIPMVEPVVRAVTECNSVAMIQVARVEWEKFSSQSLERVAEEYHKFANDKHTMLHLDHVPVIDEDMRQVDYMPIIKRAIEAGYRSVMVDASRLELAENIEASKQAADFVHGAGLPIEAELGAVMGHENKVMMPYEEIFATKAGFTKVSEAKRFVADTGCDWLSVAVGNIHGAVAEATRDQKKPEARLDTTHIEALYEATKTPLVLHGGSGIRVEYIREAIKVGIAKINVGTEIRQAYEAEMRASNDVEKAQEAVYKKTVDVIDNMLGIRDSRDLIFG